MSSKLFPDVKTEAQRYEFVVDASPDYSPGDQVGEAIAISAGPSGILESLSVINKTVALIDIAFHFFRANPTSTSGDDNSALAVSDADSELYLFSVYINKGIMGSLGGSVVGTVPVGYDYETDDGENLYVVALALDTINFAASDDLQIVPGVRKDV